ncbi:MAG: hypothetical protein H0U10_14330 [Chloroflexia bacterium]|nr:hypothetical protein [Chloroflexia bacterium]
MVATKERQQGHDGRIDCGAIRGVRLVAAGEGRALLYRQARKLRAIAGADFPRRWGASADRPIRDAAEGRRVRRWRVRPHHV